MPAGFPAFPQSRFPDDKPPTLFHPASPKIKPAKPAKAVKDIDTASMMSTSTFSSTVSLLKDNVRSKFASSQKKKTSVSEKRTSPSTYADMVNGEHKTRTLPPTSQKEGDRTEVLKDFILMKK